MSPPPPNSLTIPHLPTGDEVQAARRRSPGIKKDRRGSRCCERERCLRRLRRCMEFELKAQHAREQQVKRKPRPCFEEAVYQGLDEAVITQEFHDSGAGSSQFLSEPDNTMLSQMMEMPTQSIREQQPAGPMPDCDYILNNQPTARPVPLTTATKEGRVNKRKAAKTKGDEGTAKKKPGDAKQ